MSTISIIRNRGQLTIPDNIRKAMPWADAMSPVSISTHGSDEIIIRPHKFGNLDWEKIWSGINEARSIRKKGMQGSLSEFITDDRHSH